MSNPFEPPQPVHESTDLPHQMPGTHQIPLPNQTPQWEMLPEKFWPNLDVQVASVSGRWGRTIELRGQINDTLEYQGWGNGERLYINGHLIHTTNPFTWRLVFPYIDFNLFIDRFYVPSRIDVKASYFRLLQVSRFKLTVAGKVIHDE